MFVRRLMTMGILLVALMSSGCGQSDMQALLSQGIGTNVKTSSTADRAELLRRYFGLMCARAGLSTDRGADDELYCQNTDMIGSEWQGVVFAALNDIDERCDQYLETLNQARKDKEAIDTQLENTQTVTNAIFGISKKASKSALAAVGAAFGFAKGSIKNYYTLIHALDERSINRIVKKRQTAYRRGLHAYLKKVNSRPTAYYAIRGYLRLCLPSTIESEVVSTISDVEYLNGGERDLHDGVDPDVQALLAIPKTPKTATEQYDRYDRPGGNENGNGDVVVKPADRVGNAVGDEQELTIEKGKEIQRALCVNDSGDFGALDSNSSTRQAIKWFELARQRTVNRRLSHIEIIEIRKEGNCTDAGYKNAFERFRYSTKSDIKKLQKKIRRLLKKPAGREALKAAVADPFVTGKFDFKTRAALVLIHKEATTHIPTFPAAAIPADQMTPALSGAMDTLSLVF